MYETNDDKRNNLLKGAGKPQVGRRDEADNLLNEAKIKARNKATVRGLLLGAVVVVIAVALLMFVGSQTHIAG